MMGLLAGVAGVANAALPWAVTLGFAWIIVRLLPLVLLKQTPGQTLAGYEVRGPGGTSLGPMRAATRDLLLVSAPGWATYESLRHHRTAPRANSDCADEPDRRWPHDRLAGAWVIRREALASAPSPAPRSPTSIARRPAV